MDSDTTMREWLEATKPLVLSLADAARDEDPLLGTGSPRSDRAHRALACRLKSLREWISTNPCPERAAGDQLQLVVAQVSFVSLVLRSEPSTLDRDRLAALAVRLRALKMSLLGLVGEIEQSLVNHRVDDAIA